jgi:hypothetical protein
VKFSSKRLSPRVAAERLRGNFENGIVFAAIQITIIFGLHPARQQITTFENFVGKNGFEVRFVKICAHDYPSFVTTTLQTRLFHLAKRNESGINMTRHRSKVG